jgi:hypothetical protein
MTDQDGIRLDSAVDVVMIQISFSNKSLIPACAFELTAEKLTDHAHRMITNSGPSTSVQVIYPDRDRLVDLEGLGSRLVEAGFSNATVAFQERIDKKNVNKRYYMVRFTFRRGAPGEALVETTRAFKECMALSFWHVRGYRSTNANGTMISINGEAREQRYEADDLTKPRTVRYLDADHRSTGERGPVRATARLRLITNTIYLESLT